MLTVEFPRARITHGQTMLDVGCGRGRHTLEAAKLGVAAIGVDRDGDSLHDGASVKDAMRAAGEIPAGGAALFVRGDALRLPFADAIFDRVIASEVLEHINDDNAAMAEIARVLTPGGIAAITVPRWWPERICWFLSRAYHSDEGAHVRIYKRDVLFERLARHGLHVFSFHHAHALHSPYWWLKCAFGVQKDALLPRLYHRFLVWDITARPRTTRLLEQVLNPLLGKSLVLYLVKEARTEHASVAA